MIRRRSKKTTATIEPKKTKKSQKTHEADGLVFKSAPILKFYQELKALQESGLIKGFVVPTIKDMEKNKFRAVKCTIDGHKFDSMLESKYYLHLLREQQAGRVKSFDMQVKFILQDKFKKNGKSIREIAYVADFDITYADGKRLVIDTKGRETADFKIKHKMFDYRYPELELICVQYDTKSDTWYDTHEEKKILKGVKRGAA